MTYRSNILNDAETAPNWISMEAQQPLIPQDAFALIRTMRKVDWLFVILSFCLLWYAAYNLFGRLRDSEFVVDIMLLLRRHYVLVCRLVGQPYR
jgi:hypothetical protein